VYEHFFYPCSILPPPKKKTQSVNDAGGIALPEKIVFVPLENNKNGMVLPGAFKGVVF
jgi:hypothetical protein